MKKCIGILLCLFLCVQADEFVVPKKKNVSTSQAKQRCADSVIEALKLTPITSQLNASIQTEAFDMVLAMAEDDFFERGTKQDINNECAAYEQFVARQETINALLEQQTAFLKRQKKHYCAPISTPSETKKK
jgi:DNA-binding protein Fis